MMSLQDVEAATTTLGDDVHRTPVFSSSILGKRLGIRLFLKAELLQKTGSFKPRGALNRLRNTSEADLGRGLITVSAGNHAAGLAYAARAMGVGCTVVMPETTARSKVEAVRAYGPEIVLHGDVPQAFEHMEQLRADRGLTLVHPFDDPLVMAGQGTVGLEIVEQVPDVDAVVVPVGGGGLIAGVATAVTGRRPKARVHGVEPEGAAGMRASFDAGEAVELPAVDTAVDSLAAPRCGSAPFEVAQQRVDDVVTLTDEQIVGGMQAVWHFTKLYAEPAGAAPVAALLDGAISIDPGETVVVLVSGGNLDPALVADLLR